MSLEMGFQYQWDSSVPPTDAAHYAKRLGFESIWVGEHSHIPVQRETQFPGRGDLPVGFRTVPEPFTCLAAVSSVTNLRLGLAVLVLPMRDAIMTAKEIATLDALSAGRVMVGVGTGWLVEEMRNHGVQDYPRQAYSLLRERVEAMKQIWTNEPAEYHGKLVNFDPIWCGPKPIQRPHPPVLIAGSGPRVLDRVVAYGDGWISNAHSENSESLVQRVAQLRRRARDARGSVSMPVTVVSAPHDRDLLWRYAEGGITRVTVTMRPTMNDATDLSRLDRFAELVHEVNDKIGAPSGR